MRRFSPRFVAAGLLMAALFVLPALVTAGTNDPFAPEGMTRVLVRIPDRATLDRLLEMGLRPEEGDRERIGFLVTDEEMARLGEMGLEVTIRRPASDKDAAFATYAQITAELQQIAADHPDIARLYSYGQSVQGRDIWALKITDNPDVEEVEAEVRICGAHHGDEKMSSAVCMRLANELTDNYGSDPEITDLVDNREIWIVPIVNPDGYEANSRYNAHGVDLNRNYGYMWEYGSSGPFTEPETRAMRDLATENWFVLSLSFHTSGDVVNSVWNYTPIYTEDDDVIWRLTNDYASFNGYWPVRGWYWYETHGDCNDWSYGARADMDWTIEVSNYNESNVWNKNRDAIIYFIGAASWGIHGVVTDAQTGAPLRANVWVEGNGWPAFTDPQKGDYYKPLLAGTYTVRITANGYQDLVIPNVVVPQNGGVTVNAQLQPGGGRYVDRVEIFNVADPYNDYANHTLTMSALGAPDDVGCSLGRGGNAVLDLGTTVTDQPGDDIQVYEAPVDGSDEGFSLYGGSDYRGPWTLLGQGTGTAAFDLANAGLSEVRYLRIVDDGNGSASDPYAGYDLDAIEAFGASSGVAESGVPRGLRLLAVQPNPVASGSPLTIRLRLPARGSVGLDMLDVAGRRVRSLALGELPGGEHVLRWDGRDAAGRPVSAGAYFVRLRSRGTSLARKVVVLE
jgi:hypothetical protein